jgi:hypothetical protein
VCCQSMPGEFIPADFGMTKRTSSAQARTIIYSILKTTLVAVDWWEGDPTPDGRLTEDQKAYYLRPRIANEYRLFHAGWGGVCALLEGRDGICELSREAGCLLPDDRRPYGCRTLRPRGYKSRRCTGPGSKQKAAIAWLPYSERRCTVT